MQISSASILLIALLYPSQKPRFFLCIINFIEGKYFFMNLIELSFDPLSIKYIDASEEYLTIEGM